jgi:hypothetical protein
VKGFLNGTEAMNDEAVQDGLVTHLQAPVFA